MERVAGSFLVDIFLFDLSASLLCHRRLCNFLQSVEIKSLSQYHISDIELDIAGGRSKNDEPLQNLKIIKRGAMELRQHLYQVGKVKAYYISFAKCEEVHQVDSLTCNEVVKDKPTLIKASIKDRVGIAGANP